jgi:hypothetical protein
MSLRLMWNQTATRAASKGRSAAPIAWLHGFRNGMSPRQDTAAPAGEETCNQPPLDLSR